MVELQCCSHHAMLARLASQHHVLHRNLNSSGLSKSLNITNYLYMQEKCMVCRLDHEQWNSENLAKGGIMVVCPESQMGLSA